MDHASPTKGLSLFKCYGVYKFDWKISAMSAVGRYVQIYPVEVYGSFNIVRKEIIVFK